MSEEIYRSTFDTSRSIPSTSDETLASSPNTTPGSSEPATAVDSWLAGGNFASFICLVTHLEKKLRLESGSVFFDSESEVFGKLATVGEGASFRVQKAEWKTNNSSETRKLGRYVALKAVVPKKKKNSSSKENATDWSEVLLEVRALLHEPLRYHPNIVRMVGFGWGPTGDSNSIYPQIVLEFSEIGTMESLQTGNDAFPFPVKQKLCYDVCRGLSILHACGIVHGDLTHRNVLIYRSRIETPGLPYTAKLSDFGGSVMDLQSRNKVRMTTWPYGAPELGKVLSSDEIRNTDVYSLGIYIWRTILDGGSVMEAVGLGDKVTPQTKAEFERLKNCNELLLAAKKSVLAYSSRSDLPEIAIVLVTYCLEHSMQVDSLQRSLTKVQCALRGMELEEIPTFIEQINEKNRHYEGQVNLRAPGSHGITQIGILAYLGKCGHDIDLQENTPGLRPILSPPDAGEFQFEPNRLKTLLTWPQQQAVFKDLENVAGLPANDLSKDLQPWMAAFFLFQCYITECGVLFDSSKACRWLWKAAEPESAGEFNYRAQAWLWRISSALGVTCPASTSQQEFYVKWGIAHGHRTCIMDGKRMISSLSNRDERARWEAVVRDGTWILNHITGGVGMPWFAPRKLRNVHQLDNLTSLDDQIREQLGNDYESNLRQNGGTRVAEANRKSINQIYVNHIGHTTLHLAASLGNIRALQHLVQNYEVDLNVKDQTSYETPLVSACRCSQYECAMFLVESGANPNSADFGAESPLFWLSSFEDDQMKTLARRLVEAGAIVDQGTRPIRGDIRGVWADWEDLWSVPTTPLGRAVIMNSLSAVKVLLSLGANPLAKPDRGESRDGRCAVDLAALLTLPDILETLLAFLDSRPDEQAQIFDEQGMLQAAHDKSILPVDTTSLQSRLVRCGSDYKTSMFRTLQILRNNRHKYSQYGRTAGQPFIPDGLTLCAEVRLGNRDIIESLLELGHSVNGSPGHRPLEEATRQNHEPIFRLLVNSGANIHIQRSLENGSQFSLLQISADRPKTSRPGVFIAEYLIRGGVPIEPLGDGTKSALVLAVLNHDFEMADLLLSKGADLNAAYQVETVKTWTTLLADLAANHTEMNAKAIEYLFAPTRGPNTDREGFAIAAITNQMQNFSLGTQSSGFHTGPGISRTKPSFIVIESLNLSVLHILALCPPDAMTDTAQISSRIIHTILGAYNTPEEINFVHPVFGTPLCAAAVTGNRHVLVALLERNASKSVAAGPTIFESFFKNKLGPVVEPATPLNLAVSVIYKDYEAVLKSNNIKETYDIASRLKNAIAVAMDLWDGEPDGGNGEGGLPVATMGEIQKMVEVNEKSLRTERLRHIESLSGLGNAPIDLSTLKDRDI